MSGFWSGRSWDLVWSSLLIGKHRLHETTATYVDRAKEMHQVAQLRFSPRAQMQRFPLTPAPTCASGHCPLSGRPPHPPSALLPGGRSPFQRDLCSVRRGRRSGPPAFLAGTREPGRAGLGPREAVGRRGGAWERGSGRAGPGGRTRRGGRAPGGAGGPGRGGRDPASPAPTSHQGMEPPRLRAVPALRRVAVGGGTRGSGAWIPARPVAFARHRRPRAGDGASGPGRRHGLRRLARGADPRRGPHSAGDGL